MFGHVGFRSGRPVFAEFGDAWAIAGISLAEPGGSVIQVGLSHSPAGWGPIWIHGIRIAMAKPAKFRMDFVAFDMTQAYPDYVQPQAPEALVKLEGPAFTCRGPFGVV